MIATSSDCSQPGRHVNIEMLQVCRGTRQLSCDFTEATMPVATRRDTCMRLALFQRVWIEICFSMWICECECVRMFDHLLKQWFLYARSHVCDTECAHKGETNTDRSSFCEDLGHWLQTLKLSEVQLLLTGRHTESSACILCIYHWPGRAYRPRSMGMLCWRNPTKKASIPG